MADDVAQLMASRFGGARRGEAVTLDTMMRRRGAALPARLRKRAALLAQADLWANQPRIARQLPADDLRRAHDALVAHLQPLGEISRFQGRLIGLGASLALALLILAAVAIWIAVRRGMLGV
ncbi:hypothetical protein [Paracoccus sp. (in: a-proteobacteria)]|uniref:hypothetical protein n=1 Tax=Paracoccus sp. TaxID=267 RepID=UPI0026DF0DF3|nr:hypothetical protein [Paracoccus sp. (in: a-proteobacteria)]MDO5646678.1 hypothetical protein [Paracoccus sp. (in: a-proteobacteria)]